MKRKYAGIILLIVVIFVVLFGILFYMYISIGFTPQPMYGIAIWDANCSYDSSVTMSIQNIGKNPVTGITCIQTAPSSDTACSPGFTNVNIAPDQTQIFSGMDTCSGLNLRLCKYELTPNGGRTITTQLVCS
jgi:hypothetical protein